MEEVSDDDVSVGMVDMMLAGVQGEKIALK